MPFIGVTWLFWCVEALTFGRRSRTLLTGAGAFGQPPRLKESNDEEMSTVC
jgi:hypothetical protein